MNLHPCKGCKFATSAQGYVNKCNKPAQLEKYKAFYYTEVNKKTCGEKK